MEAEPFPGYVEGFYRDEHIAGIQHTLEDLNLPLRYEEFRSMTMEDLLEFLVAAYDSYVMEDYLLVLGSYFVRLYRETSYEHVFKELQSLVATLNQGITGNQREAGWFSVDRLLGIVMSLMMRDIRNRGGDLMKFLLTAREYNTATGRLDKIPINEVIKLLADSEDYDTFVEIYPSLSSYEDKYFLIFSLSYTSSSSFTQVYLPRK